MTAKNVRTADVLKTQADIDATQHDKTQHCDAVSQKATPPPLMAHRRRKESRKQMVGEELQVSEERGERLI